MSTGGIGCPHCGSFFTGVKDSRPTVGSIRRRRLCVACGGRFTTMEVAVGTVNDNASVALAAVDLVQKLHERVEMLGDAFISQLGLTPETKVVLARLTGRSRVNNRVEGPPAQKLLETTDG